MEAVESEVAVRAAGGLLLRRAPGGWTEIALVHRPVRDDWSYPKGKLEPGEDFETAALREVLEETGYVCSLGRFLGHTEYRDRKDRPKVVAYWSMTPERGAFTPSEEVDRLRWVDVPTARMLLTYPRDRDLLAVLPTEEEIEATAD